MVSPSPFSPKSPTGRSSSQSHHSDNLGAEPGSRGPIGDASETAQLERRIRQLMHINGQLRTSTGSLRVQIQQRDETVERLQQNLSKCNHEQKLLETRLLRQVENWEAKYLSVERELKKKTKRSAPAEIMSHQIQDLEAEMGALEEKHQREKLTWEQQRNLLKRQILSLEESARKLNQVAPEIPIVPAVPEEPSVSKQDTVRYESSTAKRTDKQLRTRLKESEQKNESLRSQVGHLRTEVIDVRQAAEEAEARADMLQTYLDASVTSANLEKKLKERLALETSEREIRQIERRSRSLLAETSNEKSEKLVKEMQETQKELRSRVSTLEAENGHLKSEIYTFQQHYEKLESQQSALILERDSLKSEMSKATEKQEDYHERFKQSQQELFQKMEIITNLENTNKEKDIAAESMRASLNEALKKAQETNFLLEDTNVQLSDSNEINRLLRTELKESREVVNQLKDQRDDLESDKRQLGEHVVSLGVECSEVREQVTKLTIDNNALREEMRVLNEAESDLARCLANAEAELAKRSNEKAELEDIIVELKKENLEVSCRLPTFLDSSSHKDSLQRSQSTDQTQADPMINVEPFEDGLTLDGPDFNSELVLQQSISSEQDAGTPTEIEKWMLPTTLNGAKTGIMQSDSGVSGGASRGCEDEEGVELDAVMSTATASSHNDISPVVLQKPRFSSAFFKADSSSSSDDSFSSTSESEAAGEITIQKPRFSAEFFRGNDSSDASSSTSSSETSTSSSNNSLNSVTKDTEHGSLSSLCNEPKKSEFYSIGSIRKERTSNTEDESDPSHSSTSAGSWSAPHSIEVSPQTVKRATQVLIWSGLDEPEERKLWHIPHIPIVQSTQFTGHSMIQIHNDCVSSEYEVDSQDGDDGPAAKPTSEQHRGIQDLQATKYDQKIQELEMKVSLLQQTNAALEDELELVTASFNQDHSTTMELENHLAKNNSQAKLEAATSKIKALEENEIALKKTLDEAAAEADQQHWRHEDALATARADIGNFRDEADRLTKELNDARGELEGAKGARATLAAELASITSSSEAEGTDLRTQLEAATSKIKALEENEIALKKTLDEAAAEADQQHWRHEDALATARADIGNFRDEADRLTKELNDARGELEGAKGARATLAAELASITSSSEAEGTDLRTQLEAAMSKIKALEENEIALKKTLDEAAAEADQQHWRHEDALATARADIGNFRDEADRLTKELNDARGELEGAKGARATLAAELASITSSSEAEGTDLRTQLEAATSKIKALEENEIALKKTLDEAAAEADQQHWRHEDALATARADIGNFRDEADRLTKELNDARGELEGAKGARATLAAELASITSSSEAEGTDLRTQLEAATSKIKALEENEIALKKSLDEVATKSGLKEGELFAELEAATTQIKALEEHQATLKNSLDEAEENAEHVQTSLKSQLDAATSKIQDFEEKEIVREETEAAFNISLDTARANAENLRKQLITTKASMKIQEEKIIELERSRQRLLELEQTRLDEKAENSRRFDNACAQLNELESEVSRLEADVVQKENRLEDAVANINDIEEALLTSQENLASAELEIKGLEGGIDSLKGERDALEKDLGKVTAERDLLRNEMEDQSCRIDVLETTISLLEGEHSIDDLLTVSSHDRAKNSSIL